MKKIINVFLVLLLIIFINQSLFAMTSIENITLIEGSLGYKATNLNENERIAKIEMQIYGQAQKGVIVDRLKKINSDLAISTENDTYFIEEDNPAEESADPTVSYPIVDNMEQNTFGKIYNTENIYKRLDRLEKQTFGQSSKLSLNERVDRLSQKIVVNLPKSKNKNNNFIEDYSNQNDDNYYYFGPGDSEYTTYNSKRSYNNNYPYSSSIASDESKKLEVTYLEKKLLKKTYPNDSVDNRLSRIERTLLNNTYPSEATETRIERLSAITTAKQSNSTYESNKLMKHLNTGIQIGGILLMILAMIL